MELPAAHTRSRDDRDAAGSVHGKRKPVSLIHHKRAKLFLFLSTPKDPEETHRPHEHHKLIRFVGVDRVVMDVFPYRGSRSGKMCFVQEK